MNSPPKKPLMDISNTTSPPNSRESFKRVSVSPSRNPKLLEKPPMRLSPQQRIQTPKRLPSPEYLRPTQSLDRYERTRSNTVKINEVFFPNSPTKTSHYLSNLPVVGGDGSLSRIKNRFKTNGTNSTKVNLLAKLSEEDSNVGKRKELSNDKRKLSELNLLDTERRTRSKSVRFQLPEDRAISNELHEIKAINSMLEEKIEKLEERLSNLEKRLP